MSSEERKLMATLARVCQDGYPLLDPDDCLRPALRELAAACRGRLALERPAQRASERAKVAPRRKRSSSLRVVEGGAA